MGGAAVLSTYFKQEKQKNPNTLIVTSGDAFGASPPLASFFEEETAVKALNLMGVQADTFGNHNFDRGIPHLQKMIGLSDYTYVSSNLGNLSANLSGNNLAAPYKIFDVGGLKVGLVASTNPDAPSITFPGRMGTLTVQDPVTASMTAATAAKAAGAKIVIAMTHMGADPTASGTTPVGALLDYANAVSGFALILGDHTDVQVDTVIKGMPVVENKSKGRTYAKISLTVKKDTGEVTAKSVTFVDPVVTGITPDPAIVSMLAPYRVQLSPQLDRVIGTATDVFVRDSNKAERKQEVPLGDLIADSHKSRYGTQLAFLNGGGIREALPSTYKPLDAGTLRRSLDSGAPPYDLIAGDPYAILPFGNVAVVRTITGAQLWDVLENSVGTLPNTDGRFLQIAGFKFTYSIGAASGARVTAVALDNATPILKDGTTYTLATVDFLNTGGNGYLMLKDGGAPVLRDNLAEVLMGRIVEAGAPLVPATSGRITQLP
jgi:5'-nucleotidase